MGSAPKSKSGSPSPRYHCGGTPSRKHTYYSVAKAEFENNIRAFVESLKFDKTFLDSFELILNNTYRRREKEIVSLSATISRNVGDLKAEQASTLDAFTMSKSEVTRKKLEEKIDSLEMKIQEAEKSRGEIEVTEKDIKSFTKYVKYVMEHPSDMLIDIDDMRAQRTLFGLVFEEIPSYQEILNGTPKLSFLFKLSENFKTNKSSLVTQVGRNWNQLVQEMYQWQQFGKMVRV